MSRYHQKIALLTLLATIQISHADNLSFTLSTSQNLTNALQLQNHSDPQSEILALNESNHSIPIHHSLDVTFTSVDLYADYGTINYLTSNDIYTNYLDSNYNYSYIAQSNQAYIDYLNAYSSDVDYLNAYSSDIVYLNAYSSEIAYLNSDDIYSDYITSTNASISNLWAYETYSNHLYTTYGDVDQLYSNEVYTNTLQSSDINAYSANISYINSDMISSNNIYANYVQTDGFYSNNAYLNDIHTGNLSSNNIDSYSGYIDQLSTNSIYTNSLQANDIYTNYLNANYGYIDQLSSAAIYTNSLQADSISLSPWGNGGIDLGSYAFADGYTSLNGPPMAIDHYRDQSGKDFYVVRETHEVYEQLSDGIKRSSVDINDLTWIQSGEMSTYVSGGGGQAIERKVTQEAVTYGEKQESFSRADAQFNFAGSSYTASILDDTSTTSTNNELVSGVIRPYTSNLDEKYGVRATSSKDGQVVAETVLTSSGLTTTGQVQAKTMLLDGEDLKTKIEQGDQNTLLAANTYTQNQVTQASENTLKAAKAEDVKVLASANQYTDTQIGMLNSNVSRLNQRIDDVKDTAYRGIAIALAAQQQIPNIGAGQMAVFGGVGHYEGETAGALGLAGVLPNGRTSLSAAFGAAGQGEVGGRVGVAYVFGAK